MYNNSSHIIYLPKAFSFYEGKITGYKSYFSANGDIKFTTVDHLYFDQKRPLSKTELEELCNG